MLFRSAEKIYGARLAGIRTVLVPEENKDDIPSLPTDITVIPVATVDEALPYFFGGLEAEIKKKEIS